MSSFVASNNFKQQIQLEFFSVLTHFFAEKFHIFIVRSRLPEANSFEFNLSKHKTDFS